MKYSIFLVMFFLYLFGCNFFNKSTPENAIQIRIDNAIYLMSKIHAKCYTTILKKREDAIDTITSNLSYLCLEPKAELIQMSNDTASVSVFFKPDTGFKTEDPSCEYAYSILYIGNHDNEPDFIEFGDNYYSLSVGRYFQLHPDLDTNLKNSIQKFDCIHPRIIEIAKKHSKSDAR